MIELPDQQSVTILSSTGVLEIETGKMLVTARRLLRKGPDTIQSDDSAVWSFVLSDAGIMADEIMPALLNYMKASEWFPAPSNIIEHAKIIREKRIREIKSHQRRQEAADRQHQEQAEQQRWNSLTPAEQQSEIAERRAKFDEIRSHFRAIVKGSVPKPMLDLTSATQVKIEAKKHQNDDDIRSMSHLVNGFALDVLDSGDFE